MMSMFPILGRNLWLYKCDICNIYITLQQSHCVFKVAFTRDLSSNKVLFLNEKQFKVHKRRCHIFQLLWPSSLPLTPLTFYWLLGMLPLKHTRHHNPLLFINCSWLLTIDKEIFFWKNLLENKEMIFYNCGL